jgi:hypothetical protein
MTYFLSNLLSLRSWRLPSEGEAPIAVKSEVIMREPKRVGVSS